MIDDEPKIDEVFVLELDSISMKDGFPVGATISFRMRGSDRWHYFRQVYIEVGGSINFLDHQKEDEVDLSAVRIHEELLHSHYDSLMQRAAEDRKKHG